MKENEVVDTPVTPPVAFVQVDLDGLWAVRRCYGAAGTPQEDDPVYSEALPVLLDLFERLEIEATFFVVGADVQVAWKRRRLEAVRDRGHEIANHSMSHHLGLAHLDRPAREREVADCQAALSDRLGVQARGFRAPGYGFSSGLLETLVQLGFWYDSSLLPLPWGWLLRWMDRRISVAAGRDKAQYGGGGGGRAPLSPFRSDPREPMRPAAKGRTLWEVPVSVSPRWRLPFHGGIGFLLGKRWCRRAVGRLARRRAVMNYVLHGLDLVDGRKWNVVYSYTGRWVFRGGTRERLGFFAETLRDIRGRFDIQRTDRWVDRARKGDENR